MFYSKEQIEKARNADLLTYLQQSGYRLIKSARNEYRLEEHDSLVISNNKWYWFSRGIGGNTLDFLIKYEGKRLTEAVGTLIGIYGREDRIVNIKTYIPEKKKVVTELKLPEKNKDCRRVYAYLIKTRCLDKEIVNDMVKEKLIYESKDTHNVVFLGKDKDGNIKHASMRGTLSDKSFKGDCLGSDKKYCFNIKGRSDTLFVFESAIDLLSHATITKMKKRDYREDHRLSSGGVSSVALFQYLEDNPGIKNVVLCLDNDEAGEKAKIRIAKELLEKGYEVSEDFPPSGKDWNEYLKKLSDRMKNTSILGII
ncbi:DUF3991 and toprim domain-containing protein [Lutispora thermophila]|uniref:DUF3991 domain-containing protein n=1 Tax=Lutispora thermophila DSM 19022 TaxID=1122184 RepID=A0A1M6IPL1_9FIRM|nr:DUF3991 and toprim domain-containing protein [Lutispora thermophila]SHJ36401.1 Protein of unknown function [Lutispora thermophila DSM 19022]